MYTKNLKSLSEKKLFALLALEQCYNISFYNVTYVKFN